MDTERPGSPDGTVTPGRPPPGSSEATVGSPPPGRRVGRFVSKAIMEGYMAEEQVRGILVSGAGMAGYMIEELVIGLWSRYDRLNGRRAGNLVSGADVAGVFYSFGDSMKTTFCFSFYFLLKFFGLCV